MPDRKTRPSTDGFSSDPHQFYLKRREVARVHGLVSLPPSRCVRKSKPFENQGPGGYRRAQTTGLNRRYRLCSRHLAAQALFCAIASIFTIYP